MNLEKESASSFSFYELFSTTNAKVNHEKQPVETGDVSQPLLGIMGVLKGPVGNPRGIPIEGVGNTTG